MRTNDVRNSVFNILWKGFAPIRRITRPGAHATTKTKPAEHLVLPNKIILGQVKEFIRDGHTVTIIVKGYSMRPFLEHCRDSVVLAPFSVLHVGDVVLAEIKKDVYVLHRIIELQEHKVTLMGDGNLKGTEQCRLQDVVAVVHTFIRNGKHIEADKPQWKRYARWWRALLPIRKYLLWIYKLNLDKQS